MPFAIQNDSGIPMIIAYEEVSTQTPEPQPTISARLIAGWICPECKNVLRAIAGPWDNPKADWWSYDHHDRQPVAYSTHQQSVRASHLSDMPRYRGDFGLDGGYLYRFDHKRLVTVGEHYGSSTTACNLGVSLSIGIRSGLRDMKYNSPSILDRLADDIATRGTSSLAKLIPDVVGLREPILATTYGAIVAWNEAVAREYREDARQEAWRKFVQRFVAY